MMISEIHEVFSFQQRPCWEDYFDNTTKKRAARKWYFQKEFSKNMVSSFYALRLWKMFAKELIKSSWKKLRNVLSGEIIWNIIGIEFCKLENDKSRIVRSLSRRKFPFIKPFCWFFLDIANLKMYECHTTFFYSFDISDGIKLRYRYTDSRIMSCKSADIDGFFAFRQS